MLVDTRRLAEGSAIDCDVCVIGGGVAGLTLARELSGAGIDVAVLESGGLAPDDANRDLYRGESAGIPYEFADGCRSRYLGGSSHCWGGWCRPLDEEDLDTREWVSHSGWPFSRQELAPYYERAHAVLQLGPVCYDAAYWAREIGRPDVRRVPLVSGRVTDVVAQFSPPVRMGVEDWPELRTAPNPRVYLWANAVEIATAAGGGQVTGVRVRTLSGRQVAVRGRRYVLGAGGIENARILLASGIGNGLVGRFFMDHPRVAMGRVEFAPEWRGNRFYDQRFHYHSPAVAARGTCVAGQFSLSPQVRREEGLLNSGAWFYSEFPGEWSGTGAAIVRFKHRLVKKDKPGVTAGADAWAVLRHPGETLGFLAAHYLRRPWLMRGVRIMTIVEPEPDPESRVTLSELRDALGMPRVRVEWRLSRRVRRTFDRTFELVVEELEAAGVARVRRDTGPVSEMEGWPATFQREGTWHHMGTTRMHESPSQGVVDAGCRVHGVSNLWVAGSSVFPTAGANYPTLTIVALALRLGDRLRRGA
jgi:choline dehydrogenase-like flavoprotein